MHRLGDIAQAGFRQALLDVVLHRFDIVVGFRLNGFDLPASDIIKLTRQCLKENLLGFGKTPNVRNA